MVSLSWLYRPHLQVNTLSSQRQKVAEMLFRLADLTEIRYVELFFPKHETVFPPSQN